MPGLEDNIFLGSKLVYNHFCFSQISKKRRRRSSRLWSRRFNWAGGCPSQVEKKLNRLGSQRFGWYKILFHCFEWYYLSFCRFIVFFHTHTHKHKQTNAHTRTHARAHTHTHTHCLMVHFHFHSDMLSISMQRISLLYLDSDVTFSVPTFSAACFTNRCDSIK